MAAYGIFTSPSSTPTVTGSVCVHQRALELGAAVNRLGRPQRDLVPDETGEVLRPAQRARGAGRGDVDGVLREIVAKQAADAHAELVVDTGRRVDVDAEARRRHELDREHVDARQVLLDPRRDFLLKFALPFVRRRHCICSLTKNGPAGPISPKIRWNGGRKCSSGPPAGPHSGTRPKRLREQLRGPARVQGDVPGAATRSRRAGDRIGVVAVRGAEEPSEDVARDGVGPGDVEEPRDVVARAELQQRRGDVGRVRRRADLVDVERRLGEQREPLLRAGLRQSVEERRADDQRFRVQLAHEPLCVELRLPVRRDRPRLGVLVVRRTGVAVEHEVGRHVNEPRARAMRGERDVPRRAHDVALERVVRLAIRRVHDELRPVLQEAPLHVLVVAQVELDDLTVRR